MNALLLGLDNYIVRLEAGIQHEAEVIAEAVAAHQVGSGSGFWKEKHRLESRLWTARALRDAIVEAGG